MSGPPVVLIRLARLPDATLDRLFAGLAIVLGVALVVLGFGLTFVVDEWNFIEWAADPSLDDLIRPFNDHWSAFPVVSYRLLLGAVGMRSYVPFHVVTVMMIVAAAAALYLLARRRAGGWAATGIAVVYLLFGSGYENFWWAFQVGFVGSVAAGLWGVVLLDGTSTDRRRVAAAVLFGIAISASSPGAILLGGAIVAGLLRRDARTLLALAVPTAVYGVWLVATASMRPTPPIADLGALVQAPPYILEGLARTAGGAIGILGSAPGWIAVSVLTTLAIAAAVVGWRPSPTLVGLLATAIALFASVAALRGYLGVAAVSSSRYLYVAAPVVGVMLAELGPVLVRAAERRGSGARFALLAIGILVLDVALLGNVRILSDARGVQLRSAREVRAAIDVLTGPDAASCDVNAVETRPEEVVVATMPGRETVSRLLARFGDPRSDVLVPWAVVPPDLDDRALARRLLCRP